MKPFIYIASLRRTGSKVLSEALSLYPYSFIFREPKLGSGKFKARPVDIEILSKHGIDPTTFQHRISGVKHELAAERFKQEVLPELLRVFPQIGIKEIHHKHWRNVYRAFPDMKVVLTGRDPRDIYLSLYHKFIERKIGMKGGGPLTPQNIVRDLKQDFKHQIEMFNTLECLKVRYEDFCMDPEVFRSIKTFVNSDIPGIGIIGHLSKRDYLVHGYTVTNKRVCRWENETDKRLVCEAQEVFDNLQDYCKFWKYDK
jgi:hypothetical protein